TPASTTRLVVVVSACRRVVRTGHAVGLDRDGSSRLYRARHDHTSIGIRLANVIAATCGGDVSIRVSSGHLDLDRCTAPASGGLSATGVPSDTFTRRPRVPVRPHPHADGAVIRERPSH